MNEVGFAVVYRWRLHPGRDDDFVAAWEEVTRAIRAERGGLGSRLHRADDGTWVAYARWPDRETWEAAQAAGPVAPDATALMDDAVAERFLPQPLTPVADRMDEGPP